MFRTVDDGDDGAVITSSTFDSTSRLLRPSTVAFRFERDALKVENSCSMLS